MSNVHPGRIFAQDVVPDDGTDDMMTALPISQSEIDELLYGDDRSAEERIVRLQELAEQLRNEKPADFGDNDPGALLGEVNEAIAQLSGGIASGEDLDNDEPSMDEDPLAHRETLSPDSDELEKIEESDAASFTDGSEPLPDEVLDPEEWAEDGFDASRGVR